MTVPASTRVAQLCAHYAARRARDRVFTGVTFADPSWDILVDLAIKQELGERVSVSSACIASAAPPTTALRHIANLSAAGFIVRQPDPVDGRRAHLRLTPATMLAFEQWVGRTWTKAGEAAGVIGRLEAENAQLRQRLAVIRELAA